MARIDVPNFVSYRAGSTVSGTVSVDQAVTVHMQRISISLRGHCQTQIDNPARAVIVPWEAKGTKDNRGSVALFCQELTLCNRSNLPSARSTWPFSITFPSNCDPPPADVAELGCFTSTFDANQFLPPSCSDIQTKSGGRFQYSIFYELEACIMTRLSEQQDWINSKSATKRLTYLGSANLDHPGSRPTARIRRITCQSVLLPAKYQQRSVAQSRTFGERMGLKSVTPDAGATAIFWVKVMVPTVAAVNQTLPLVLSIDHDMELSTTLSPPIVMLKRVKAVLEATPQIRCDRGHKLAHWTREYTVIDHVFSKPTPLKEDIELTDFKLRQSLIPSFNSFIVQMKNVLVIELTLECAQKTLVNTFRTVDNFVLIADGHNGALAPALPSVEVTDTRPPPLSDMDPPPPYEP